MIMNDEYYFLFFLGGGSSTLAVHAFMHATKSRAYSLTFSLFLHDDVQRQFDSLFTIKSKRHVAGNVPMEGDAYAARILLTS